MDNIVHGTSTTVLVYNHIKRKIVGKYINHLLILGTSRSVKSNKTEIIVIPDTCEIFRISHKYHDNFC